MGLVDGPGIRTVVFMSGCALRCKFCHNPDSWAGKSEAIDSDALFSKILRFRPYFERSGGGVTFSGGEPLLQTEFVTEMFRLCREKNIHTCLDTAGVGSGDYGKLLSLTDLVLYDVKALDESSYIDMCSHTMRDTEDFAAEMRRAGTKIYVRQVVVPGINDTDEYMAALYGYIKEKLPGAEKVELLPYHTLGSHKYKKLGIEEPLSGVPPMDEERVKEFYDKYFKEFRGA